VPEVEPKADRPEPGERRLSGTCTRIRLREQTQHDDGDQHAEDWVHQRIDHRLASHPHRCTVIRTDGDPTRNRGWDGTPRAAESREHMFRRLTRDLAHDGADHELVETPEDEARRQQQRRLQPPHDAECDTTGEHRPSTEAREQPGHQRHEQIEMPLGREGPRHRVHLRRKPELHVLVQRREREQSPRVVHQRRADEWHEHDQRQPVRGKDPAGAPAKELRGGAEDSRRSSTCRLPALHDEQAGEDEEHVDTEAHDAERPQDDRYGVRVHPARDGEPVHVPHHDRDDGGAAQGVEPAHAGGRGRGLESHGGAERRRARRRRETGRVALPS
jgi:hypothetical protein